VRQSFGLSQVGHPDRNVVPYAWKTGVEQAALSLARDGMIVEMQIPLDDAAEVPQGQKVGSLEMVPHPGSRLRYLAQWLRGD
jgi:hypothetical protein